MSDPVADAFSSLYRRETAAIAQFRDAAARTLSRFPSLQDERENLVEEALTRTLAVVAEFRNIDDAAARNAMRAALAAHGRRAAGLASVGEGADAADVELYQKILQLPPIAREFVVIGLVKRGEFAEVIKKLNLTGAALAAELTSIRRIVNSEAAMPPQADFPAYVRVPFLVSGHLPADEALKVREYLGQSEACRGAYRDFDLLERKIARLGPAAGETHPEVAEILTFVDGVRMDEARRDAIAEHLRLCGGCAAAFAELRASSARGAAGTFAERFKNRGFRQRAAIASVAAAFVLPVLIYQLTAGRRPVLEFGVGAGQDLGKPLMQDPERGPTVVSLAVARPALGVKVRVEPNIVFDLILQKAGGAEIFTMGDVPVFVPPGEEIGNITFTVRGARLEPGDYQLHLLRRIRGAGGLPADWIYPIRFTE